MGKRLIEGVYFYPQAVITTTGGSVMHAVKGLDNDLPEFGECYFSTVTRHDPKAWKKHLRMTCNLFVPRGAVQFVFYDDRVESENHGQVVEFVLSTENYGRLVIKPGIWFGFAGVGEEEGIILNVADLRHDPAESFRLEPGSAEIPYQWIFKEEI